MACSVLSLDSGSFLFRIISNLVGVILSSGLDRCLMQI